MLRWRLLLIAAVSIVAPPDVSATENQETAKPLESFHVAPLGGHLVVPVRVFGRQWPFVLDTGCSFTCFDISMRDDLGEPVDDIKLVTPNGSKRDKLYLSPLMGLGSVTFRPVTTVVCADFAPVRKFLDARVDGCLGTASLRSFVVQIDFDQGRVNFFSPGASDTTWGDRFPLSFAEDGTPQLELTVSGVASKFTIDTGAWSTTVGTALVDSLRAAGKLQRLGSMTHDSAFGSDVRATYTLERLAIGRFVHSDLHIDQGTWNKIGLRYLSRYRVTFDFPRGEVYLSPGAHFSDPDRINLSGLHLIEQNGTIRVDSVDEDTPAAAAGIERDDQITQAIAGGVSYYELHALRRLFRSDEGRKVLLTTMRSGKTREVEIFLRAPTPPSEKADADPAPKTD